MNEREFEIFDNGLTMMSIRIDELIEAIREAPQKFLEEVMKEK